MAEVGPILGQYRLAIWGITKRYPASVLITVVIIEEENKSNLVQNESTIVGKVKPRFTCIRLFVLICFVIFCESYVASPVHWLLQ